MDQRWETEIIQEILLEATQESTKTRLLHKTNLNIRTFNKFFNMLIKKGLIEPVVVVEGKKHSKYRVTEKGKTLSIKLKEIHEILMDAKKAL